MKYIFDVYGVDSNNNETLIKSGIEINIGIASSQPIVEGQVDISQRPDYFTQYGDSSFGDCTMVGSVSSSAGLTTIIPGWTYFDGYDSNYQLFRYKNSSGAYADATGRDLGLSMYLKDGTLLNTSGGDVFLLTRYFDNTQAYGLLFFGEHDSNGFKTGVFYNCLARVVNFTRFLGNCMSVSAENSAKIIQFLNDLDSGEGPIPGEDPYAQGGTSGGGGGTGTFSRTGDTIGEHDLPTLSAVDAGFITLFAPKRGEMKSLASYLWGDLFSLDTFKKIVANPMDAILGLSIVPVQVPTSGSETVKVGNISTGVSMTKASTQYVKLSCGSLQVDEYWGAYLDYSPYTKCEIYLPYIGVHELSIDDVMGKTIKVVYYIDILSGACTAEIYSEGTCLYSFVGQCSASIPISSNDWTNVINGVMQIGAAVGSLVASGGLSAPISGGMLASGLKTGASVGGTVTASKPSVERSGSMSGAGGMLGQQNPYLIITWPKECIPASQNKFIGYPSFVTVTLGDITGFNIVESVHLENIPATSEELDEIESLLMNGVIF